MSNLPYRSKTVWVDHPPEVVAFCEELQALQERHGVTLTAESRYGDIAENVRRDAAGGGAVDARGVGVAPRGGGEGAAGAAGAGEGGVREALRLRSAGLLRAVRRGLR